MNFYFSLFLPWYANFNLLLHLSPVKFLMISDLLSVFRSKESILILLTIIRSENLFYILLLRMQQIISLQMIFMNYLKFLPMNDINTFRYLIIWQLMVNFFEKVKRTIAAQKQKYRRKGAFNAILAWILLFVTIWCLREVAISCWPTNLQLQDRVNFVIKVSLLLHFSCEIVFCLIYLPGYLGLSSFYDRHLINREKKRPWELQSWPDFISKTLKVNFLISWVMSPGLMLLGMKFGSIRFRFDNFPGFWEVFWQINVLVYLQDIVQYVIHRLFHEVKFLYKFHKMHHEHETPFVLSAEYGDPFNYLCNVIPQKIMFMSISSHIHICTFFFFAIFKSFTLIEAHSGYEFHFSPTRIAPFVISSAYHDFHHSHNVGNYANTLYILDTFLSETPTNQQYFDFLTAKEEKEEKEERERLAAKKVK